VVDVKDPWLLISSVGVFSLASSSKLWCSLLVVKLLGVCEVLRSSLEHLLLEHELVLGFQHGGRV